MRYSLENNNREIKSFSFDETEYTLICENDFVAGETATFFAEKLDFNPAAAGGKVSEYVSIFESDKPFCLSHFTCYAIGTLTQVETDFVFDSGKKLPDSYLPVNAIVNDDSWIQPQILIAETVLNNYSLTPNTFNCVMGLYDKSNYFATPITDKLNNFFDNSDLSKYFAFYFANRMPTDLAVIRQNGFQTMWFINKFEEEAVVKVRIYKKTLTDDLVDLAT